MVQNFQLNPDSNKEKTCALEMEALGIDVYTSTYYIYVNQLRQHCGLKDCDTRKKPLF